MISWGLIVVTLSFPAPVGDVNVTYDQHKWRVHSREMSAPEKCQAKVDAKRVISGRPVTQGLPFKCTPKWARKMKPDPSP